MALVLAHRINRGANINGTIDLIVKNIDVVVRNIDMGNYCVLFEVIQNGKSTYHQLKPGEEEHIGDICFVPLASGFKKSAVRVAYIAPPEYKINRKD